MVERSLKCEAESRETQSSLARSQTCQPQVQMTGLGCHQWGWSHLQRMLGNMAPLKHRPQQGQPHPPAPGPAAPTPIEICPIFGCRPPEVLTMSHKPMHPPDTAAMCSVRQAPRFTPEKHMNPYGHTNMQRRMHPLSPLLHKHTGPCHVQVHAAMPSRHLHPSRPWQRLHHIDLHSCGPEPRDWPFNHKDARTHAHAHAPHFQAGRCFGTDACCQPTPVRFNR